MIEKNEWIKHDGSGLPKNVEIEEMRWKDGQIRINILEASDYVGKEVVFDNLVNNFGETVRLPLPDAFNVKDKDARK